VLGLKGGGDFPDLFGRLRRIGGIFRYVFSDAKISGTTFDGSEIFLGDFGGAQIEGTKFRTTRLTFVSFRDAKLTVVDFSGSSLSEVDFENANLDRVSFAKADIKAANFTGAELNDEIDFTEAEWWMARGWTEDQFKQLELKFPHSSFARSDRYSNEIKTRLGRVETAKNSKKNDGNPGGQINGLDTANKGLASELNSLAWYRAMHGAELANALAEVELALAIIVDADSLDTKAYILMQQGNFVEAKRLLAQALGMDPGSSTPPDLRKASPAIIYRYALALDYTGETAAGKSIHSKTMYEPTHERLLVSRPANPKQQ
jgi:tetratricopeptide (TPR) repeat protein